MDIQKHVPIGNKTTMRIGGEARYYCEITTQEDCEQVISYATEHKLPLVVLGGGSNTIFADGTIDALVVRMKADAMTVDGTTVTVQCGKNLAILINELAEQGLDLSALTGIPGSVGGAIVGNAGQGAAGKWINAFVTKVTAFTKGEWEELDNESCEFAYRESTFKAKRADSIVWQVELNVPQRNPEEITQEIEALLQKRLETQPHIKTSGSCFKSIDGVPAWKFVDEAGLRGVSIGGVQVSEKHANFLLNDGNGTFADAVKLVQQIEESVDRPLEVEMRFVKEDGSLKF